MTDFRIDDIKIDDVIIDLPPTFQYKECPHCGKTATGRNNILSFFGERTFPNWIVYYQSWCRPCRINQKRRTNLWLHKKKFQKFSKEWKSEHSRDSLDTRILHAWTVAVIAMHCIGEEERIRPQCIFAKIVTSSILFQTKRNVNSRRKKHNDGRQDITSNPTKD